MHLFLWFQNKLPNITAKIQALLLFSIKGNLQVTYKAKGEVVWGWQEKFESPKQVHMRGGLQSSNTEVSSI